MNAAVPLLKKGVAVHGDASIVNIASAVAEHPSPGGMGVYSAAKAALLSLGRTAAAELGSARIRVNTVSPGAVETNILTAAGAPPEGECRTSPPVLEPAH